MTSLVITDLAGNILEEMPPAGSVCLYPNGLDWDGGSDYQRFKRWQQRQDHLVTMGLPTTSEGGSAHRRKIQQKLGGEPRDLVMIDFEGKHFPVILVHGGVLFPLGKSVEDGEDRVFSDAGKELIRFGPVTLARLCERAAYAYECSADSIQYLYAMSHDEEKDDDHAPITTPVKDLSR